MINKRVVGVMHYSTSSSYPSVYIYTIKERKKWRRDEEKLFRGKWWNRKLKLMCGFNPLRKYKKDGTYLLKNYTSL